MLRFLRISQNVTMNANSTDLPVLSYLIYLTSILRISSI